MTIKKLLLGLWMTVLLASCTFVPSNPFGPTATASLTPSPSITPSPSATITPSPSPTPVPLARVGNGEQALVNGDYDTARAEFQAALNQSDDAELSAAALWGLVRANYASKRYQDALVYVRKMKSDYPDSPFLAYTYFVAGQIHSELNHLQEAADAFSMYLDLRPGLLESYVEELRGDALYADADYAAALSAYQTALTASRLDDGIGLEIKVGRSHAGIGDYANALATYDTIFARTNNDYVKAQMDYLAGYTQRLLGESEAAYERYLHAVENYPLAYDSYVALVELVDAGIPVNDFDRGLVDYYAGQYDVALVAFDRYIKNNSENDGTVHYYRALTLDTFSRYDEELVAWDTFINNYSGNARWSDGWEEKAYLQWLSFDNNKAAAQTLLDFVRVAPSNEDAPDFLMLAARILEYDNQLEEAASVWASVSDAYPSSDLVSDALFLAGITSYRLDDYAQALTYFQRDLLLSIDPGDQARAYLWIGKTQQQLGDNEAKQTAWQQAQSVNPTGYYSERARDLLTGIDPFAPPIIYHPETDIAKERAEAASWVRVTFGLPSDTDLSNPGPLLSDIRLQRGREFWELGLYDEARLEFESLRADVKENPADSFRLANYLLDIGMYRSAIFAVRQVLSLAGLDSHADSLRAPAYFSHVRYGTYYNDLVTSAAEEYDFHPLFIFSVMRQESLFEGFVHSTAGARGLMQIIPSTGTSIAYNSGWPLNFTPEDLYRPIVSVNLGTRYLASNQLLLEDDIYAMLAAYNGGPGNALVWQGLANHDPDLFLEVVRFRETRQYIQSIYETYNIYRSLYSDTP